jgi:hypothetical protein
MPRNCSVCRHPQRHEIEADLQAGKTYRDVARQYGASKDAVSRHAANHAPLHATPAVATVTKAIALLDTAVTANAWNTTLVAVQEARRCIKELLTQL